MLLMDKCSKLLFFHLLVDFLRNSKLGLVIIVANLLNNSQTMPNFLT